MSYKSRSDLGLTLIAVAFWGLIIAAFLTAVIQQEREEVRPAVVNPKPHKREIVLTPEEREKFEAYLEQENENAEYERQIESEVRDASRFGGGY